MEAKEVYNIVTDDETWLYHYEPETKCQSTDWCFLDDEPLTKVQKSRSSRRFVSVINHFIDGYDSAYQSQVKKIIKILIQVSYIKKDAR